MGLSIVPHQACAVYTEDGMQVVNGNVVYQHIIASLEERRVHGENRNEPLFGHTRSHGHGVFLCDLVSTAGQLDAFGHKAILSGTSRYLADLIRVRLGCKTRAIEFSTLQRCASHLASRTDITEAYQVGGAAVEAAVRGETAKMAAIKRKSDQPYRAETEMVDVTKVANFEKKVPLDWITEDGMHVNENFERYARPLIQAELTPIYINGVPRHIHL